jgi:membrane protein DedA with SNARE-associated domain
MGLKDLKVFLECLLHIFGLNLAGLILFGWILLEEVSIWSHGFRVLSTLIISVAFVVIVLAVLRWIVSGRLPV